MKNVKYIVVIYIVTLAPLFGDVDFDHGFSLGDISFYTTKNYRFKGSSVLGYRFLETNSGIGLSFNALISNNSTYDNKDREIFDGVEMLSLEVNWEPLYKPKSFWGLGGFYRINHIDSLDNLDWRTGVRFDIRTTDTSFIYPFIALEAGYWKDHGVYGGVKFDLIFILLLLEHL